MSGAMRRRLVACAATLLLTPACSVNDPVSPALHSVSGPVVVTAFLVDAAGNFGGTRVDSDADGIRVDLFKGATLVRTTLTSHGTYRFDGLVPGGYALRARIDDVVNDSTRTITIVRSDVLIADTLRLVSHGDLFPVPNPAFPTTRIYFELAESLHVRVRVLDASGRLVRLLLDTVRPKGLNQIPWLGDDSLGVAAPRGLFWLTLDTPLEKRTHALYR